MNCHATTTTTTSPASFTATTTTAIAIKNNKNHIINTGSWANSTVLQNTTRIQYSSHTKRQTRIQSMHLESQKQKPQQFHRFLNDSG